MDMVSFQRAIVATRRGRSRRLLEEATNIRVAHHGDEKAWKQWTRQLARDSGKDDRKDAGAFLTQFGGGL